MLPEDFVTSSRGYKVNIIVCVHVDHMIRYTWHGQYHTVLKAVHPIGSMINIVTGLVITQCVITMVKIVKVI